MVTNYHKVHNTQFPNNDLDQRKMWGLLTTLERDRWSLSTHVMPDGAHMVTRVQLDEGSLHINLVLMAQSARESKGMW